MPGKGTFSRVASLSLVVQAAGIGLAFVTQVVIARLLGVAEFGLFAWCIAAVNAAAVFARIGLDTAILRFGAASLAAGCADRYAALFRFAQRRTFRTALVAAPLVSLVIVWLRGGEGTPDVILVAGICGLWFPILAVNGIRQSALLARGWVVRSSAPETIIRPLVLLLSVGAVFLLAAAPAARHAVAAAGVSVAVAFLVGQHWIRDLTADRHAALADSEKGEFLKASYGLFLLGVTYAVLSQIDLLALGGVATADELGEYSAAKQISSVSLLGLFAIQSGMSPALAAAYASGDKVRIETAVSFVAWTGVVFAVATTLLILLGSRFLLGIFGPGFQEGVGVLYVLLGAQLLIACNGPAGVVASMTGCHAAATRAYLVAAVIVVCGTAGFYGRFGTLAPAWATLVGTACWVTALRLHLARVVGIDTMPRLRSLRLWRAGPV